MDDLMLGFDNLPGEIEIKERGKQDEHGFWSAEDLVCIDVVDDINARISVVKNGVQIGLSVHHIENEETKRAFHATIDWNLKWNEVRELRDFLSLLLNWHQHEK